ncbi:MAG: hypothetical protein DBX03_02770 [Puniceicoccaceae bacterium]|nr:MAG: hypothetical protein DBX03_02770 [Puniceicoccaceae bacterium]
MTEQQAFKNKALFASAGTGKTYRLTDRYIYTLHHTIEPRKIIALTFTRAAAGEFFEKIVEKLHRASSEEIEARALSKRLKINADSAHYRGLLKRFLKELHQLNLQTLDSFLYKILNCLGPEMGLSDQIELLSESAKKHYEKAVRDSILHTRDARRSTDSSQALQQFWYGFKQSSYGDSTNSIDQLIQQYIESLQDLYLEAPSRGKWGSVKKIWGKYPQWINDQPIDWMELAEGLRSTIPDSFSLLQKNTLYKAAEAIQNYAKGEKLNSYLNRALEEFESLRAGKALIKIGKSEVQIEGTLCQSTRACIEAIVNYHIQRSAQSTQGTHTILEQIHTAYDRQVRQRGKLTFSDLIHILNPKSPLSPFYHDPVGARDSLYYRLDARYDHWLFDEFQDTSRTQWQIIEDLVDEAMQDERRSTFFVGDSKQSLYLWRNSDDRLFQSLYRSYENTFAPLEHISESYRSAPVIMEAVNAVFDRPQPIMECFGPTISQRWSDSWQTHFSNKEKQDQSGYASWIKVGKNADNDLETSLLHIIKGLKAKANNLSIGILVGQNKEAVRLAYFLREQGLGLPVRVGSSMKPAKDNLAGVALIAMLKYCIRPSDAVSKRYLKTLDASTKTHGLSALQCVDEHRAIANALRASELIRIFSQVLISKLSSHDQRHRKTLQYLIENATHFEREENPSLSTLINYLENFSTQDRAQNSSLTVETIHRSKGLEYDVVLFINNDKRAPRDRGISAYRDASQSVEWLIEPFKKSVMQALPPTAKLLKQIEEERHFSILCKLYVAMTRAKRALYMLSDFTGMEKQTALHFLVHCLGDTTQSKSLFPSTDSETALSVLWECGTADWHQSLPPPKAQAHTEGCLHPNQATEQFHPTHQRLNELSPSQSKFASTQVQISDRQSGIHFGQGVHRAFESIDWYHSKLKIQTVLDSKLDASIVQTLENCFNCTSFQDLFKQPDQAFTLWKEKAFSLCEKQTLIHGIFDRVHLLKSSEGTYQKAQIIDFKTDSINQANSLEEAIERHRKQMEHYRFALSRLINMDQSQIECYLIFTSIARIHQLT